MKFKLYTDAVLNRNMPKYRLKRGDVVKLIERHTAPDGTRGYSIEAFNVLGETVAVTTVDEADLEPLREDEIFHVRQLAAA
jgi:hypothetical protein